MLHQDPPDLAETTSLVFLGMSIGCAKCHNHPLEKWTNNQYFAMANLFARVRSKDAPGGNRVVFAANEGDLVQPLTGPASGLGIPVKNAIMIWPKTVAGQNIKLVVLDDASDPTAGVKAAQRLVTEDKVDVIVGSSATPVAIPMADVTAEASTPQLATSPAALPPGKDKWFFRLTPRTCAEDLAKGGRR